MLNDESVGAVLNGPIHVVGGRNTTLLKPPTCTVSELTLWDRPAEREIVASFKPPHGRGTQYNSAKTLNGLFLCREMGQTDRHTDRPQHCLSSDKAVL